MIEFRTGEGSMPPPSRYSISGSSQATGSRRSARGSRHALQAEQDKTYRRQGKELQVGGRDRLPRHHGRLRRSVHGHPPDAKPMDERSRPPAPAYKRGQREYRAQRTPSGSKQMEPEVLDRVKQMRERKAAEDAAKAQPASTSQRRQAPVVP